MHPNGGICSKTEVAPRVGVKRRPILVVLPFDQPYLPEFESFSLFREHDSLILTNSKDVISHLSPKIKLIDPHFITTPFNRLLLYKFSFSKGLEHAIEQYQPEAIVTFELYSTLSYQVSLARLRHTYTHFVICYDTVPINRSLWGMFPPTRIMARIVSNKADAVIGLSRRVGVALEFSGVHKSKIGVIYPGVENNLKNSPKNQTRSGGDTPFRILFLGRLRVNKGLGTLIAAFSSIQADGINDLELVIAGNGPLEDQIREKVKQVGGMKYIGLVQGEEKRRAFMEADVFVYPSEDTTYMSRFIRWEEQTAAAVREAMSYGKPVVVSDSGSLPELVGRTDVVFRQRDSAELKEKLLLLYNSPALKREIGEFNLSRSKELFPLDSISSFIEQTLSRLQTA